MENEKVNVGLIVRCEPRTYEEIKAFIEMLKDTKIVYMRFSKNKLYISEQINSKELPDGRNKV